MAVTFVVPYFLALLFTSLLAFAFPKRYRQRNLSFKPKRYRQRNLSFKPKKVYRQQRQDHIQAIFRLEFKWADSIFGYSPVVRWANLIFYVVFFIWILKDGNAFDPTFS